MPWWSRETDSQSAVDGSRPSVRGGIHDLAARNARAAALFASGNAKEAADLFEDTLRGCRALLGRDHHATLTVAGNLGVARVSAGRRREGIQLIADNVADRARVFGEEDPRTLTALDALAATALLSAAMQDAEQSLPARHPHRTALVECAEAIGMTTLEG